MVSLKETPEGKRLRKLGEWGFVKYSWYLYTCIIAFAALINIGSILWARWRRQKYSSRTISTTTIHKGGTSTNRIFAAILTAIRIMAFRWRIPAVNMTLLEVLLTIIYTVVLICFEYTNTFPFHDIGLWANRAGHLAAVQFPLLVALSGKNNIIGLITGLSHEKLGLLHRMVARVLMIMIWLHLAGTYLHWLTGVHRHERSWIYAPWIVAGAIACIAHTLLVFMSWEPIRRRFYEFFYISHMVLVIIAMVCSVYHVHLDDLVNYTNLYTSQLFWPCLIVWAIDRSCRLLRVFLLNSVFKPRKDLGQVELITSDTLLITIKRKIPRGLKWHAGQHMFVAFPSLGPGQSHPFTVASLPSKDTEEQELVFLSRVKEGFTRKLRNHVLEVGTCDVPIILDGPYGSPVDITPFSTCVFIAGGSGATFTLPRFEHLVNELNNDKACARRIVYVWTIRERAHMRWISRRLSEISTIVPSHVSLTVTIFLTSGSAPELPGGTSGPPHGDMEKNVGEDDSKSSVDDFDAKLDGVTVIQGRPDARKILEEEVTASEGPVSVDVSGPQSLIADTRSALTSGFAGPLSVLKGAPTVQLNVEAFSL